ncbi:MAG: hypothetical protein WCT45_02805 [Candidatus Paceibacterota bacterium]
MGFSLLLGPTSLAMGNVLIPRSEAPVAPAEPVEQSRPVTVTAYNAVAGQTDETPLETASGAYSNPEIVAARSANLAKELPFGTIIELDGSDIAKDNTCGFSVVAPIIGYRVIEDSMNSRYTDRIDVLLSNETTLTKSDGSAMNAAHVLGICKGVTYRVVGYVDINHIPKTQADLARLVHGSGKTLALSK